MEKAKVYTTNLRTHGTTSLLDKLERLVKQAGIENLDFQDNMSRLKFILASREIWRICGRITHTGS